MDQFHATYYQGGRVGETWSKTHWMGVRTLKCPLDLWIYQELLHELRPDWIIETGTNQGGSAHFLGSMCELLGHGRVVTIDIEAQRSESASQMPNASWCCWTRTTAATMSFASSSSTTGG